MENKGKKEEKKFPEELEGMKETSTIRKNYKIHFISSNKVETITSTKKANNPYEGELTTDREEYSVDFINRYRRNGFLKIYRK